MNKMKKISIFTIILYMLLMTTVFATTATISVSAARLRKEANTESDVLAKIYEGEQIEILEKNGEWYKIKYNNKVGYLKNDLIQEESNTNSSIDNTKNNSNESINKELGGKKQEDNADEIVNESLEANSKIIINSQTKLRYQPSMMSNVIIEIDEGKELTKNCELGNWIQVTDGNVTGWVIKAKTLNTNNTPESEDSKKTEEQENKDFDSLNEGSEENTSNKEETNKDKNNTNKENNKDNTNIGTNKDTENNKNEENNKEVDNTKTEDKNKGNSNENNNKSETLTSNKKGIVNVETAKVRKNADKTSKIIGFLDYNDEITILAEEGEWYKFSEKNIEGYVHKTLVTLINEGTVSSRGTYESRDSEKKSSENLDNVEDNVINKGNETSNATENKGQEVANLAKQYLGYKYVVGGKNPKTGFDCSGFTRYIFLQYGYSLGTTAAGQNNLGREVKREELLPGDLILFYDEDKNKIGHTGIYISNGDFIHSANPTRGVVIDNINTNSYYNERYFVAKRIVE